jgi:hypothetical protein
MLCDSNNLTDLPEDFGDLQQLQVLRIKYNQLARVPSAVCRLPQLATLELSGNQIVKLDSSVAKVRRQQCRVWLVNSGASCCQGWDYRAAQQRRRISCLLLLLCLCR